LNIRYARNADEILVYTSTLSEFIEILLGVQIAHTDVFPSNNLHCFFKKKCPFKPQL